MRTTREITINDNGNEYRYRLTKLSALKLIKWGERTICALAEAGILGRETTSSITDGMALIGDLISREGLNFLGKLDCDRTDELLISLVNQTAERIVGGAIIKVDDKDLDILEDPNSILQLGKECFMINFPQFAPAERSESQPSPQTTNPTSRHGISVQKSR